LPLGADTPLGQFNLQVAWIAEDMPHSQSLSVNKISTGFELGAITITK
jgi:hypothetical protein